jgi:hypothetical protein
MKPIDPQNPTPFLLELVAATALEHARSESGFAPSPEVAADASALDLYRRMYWKERESRDFESGHYHLI